MAPICPCSILHLSLSSQPWWTTRASLDQSFPFMTCLPTAICTPGDSRSTRRSAGSFDWFASTAKVHPSATSIAHSDIFPQSFSSVCLHQGRAAQYGRKAKHRVILSENKVKKQSDADKSAVYTRLSNPPVAFSTDYRLNHYSHKQRKALDPHTHPPHILFKGKPICALE